MRIVGRISLRHVSGKYRVAEGAPGSLFEPGSWVDVSFGGVRHAGGIAALLRQGSLAFYYLQLLSAAAAAEDRARTGHLPERTRESARRDGISASRLCGDAGTCASLDERAATGNALD